MIMPINSQSRETRETTYEKDFQGFACKNIQLFRDKSKKQDMWKCKLYEIWYLGQ